MTGVAPKRRVLLIGWDAADWNFIDPLIDRGLMPTLAAFRQRSARGRIATLQPALSPMLWTSIVTGKRPPKHGILGFVETLPGGLGVRPVASSSRKTKALWNIAHQAGLRTNAVGFYASHPAEPIRGVAVSNQFEIPLGPIEQDWPIPAGSIHPPHLADELQSLRVHPSEITAEVLLPFIPLAASIDQTQDRRLQSLQRLLAQCLSIHAVTTHLVEHTEWDLTAVYYEAIDRTAHDFMAFHPPKLLAIPDRDFELYQHVMTGMYRFHDMMLDRLLTLAGPETTVILVSDHGYLHDHRRPGIDGHDNPVAWHSNMGLVAMAGPGVKPSAQIFGATLLDVAPTTLALLGLPAGRDMDGRTWAESLDFKPPAQIESWDKLPGDAAMLVEADLPSTPAAADLEALKQLAALGYIDAPAVTAPAHTDPADTNSSTATISVADTQNITQFNLARSLLDANRPADAAREFAALLDRNPSERSLPVYLAVALLSDGQIDRARDIITPIAESPDAPPRASLVLANIAIMSGDLDRGLQLLHTIAESHPGLLGVQLRLGKIHLTLSRWDDARLAFQRALDIAPDDPTAHDGLAEAALAVGNAELARQHALEAVDLAHFFPRAHFHLSQALALTGQLDTAILAAELSLKQAPTHAAARAHLANLLDRAARPADAIEHRMKLQGFLTRLKD